MAGKGGARPGAGRPRTAIKHTAQVASAEKRIADRLPRLIDNMFALADGVKEINGAGAVYTRPPDRQANEYLINRVLGKTPERVIKEMDLNKKRLTIPGSDARHADENSG